MHSIALRSLESGSDLLMHIRICVNCEMYGVIGVSVGVSVECFSFREWLLVSRDFVAIVHDADGIGKNKWKLWIFLALVESCKLV